MSDKQILQVDVTQSSPAVKARPWSVFSPVMSPSKITRRKTSEGDKHFFLREILFFRRHVQFIALRSGIRTLLFFSYFFRRLIFIYVIFFGSSNGLLRATDEEVLEITG